MPATGTKYEINERLFFLSVPEGALFHCLSTESIDGADLFRVSMSPSSLQNFLNAVTKNHHKWENNDRSFSAQYADGKAELSFVLQGPPGGRHTVILTGEELDSLKQALQNLIA